MGSDDSIYADGIYIVLSAVCKRSLLKTIEELNKHVHVYTTKDVTVL